MVFHNCVLGVAIALYSSLFLAAAAAQCRTDQLELPLKLTKSFYREDNWRGAAYYVQKVYSDTSPRDDTDTGIITRGTFEGKGASRRVYVCLDTDREYIVYLEGPPSGLSSDIKIGMEVCHEVMLEPNQHVAVSISQGGCEIISEVSRNKPSFDLLEIDSVTSLHHDPSWEAKSPVERLQSLLVPTCKSSADYTSHNPYAFAVLKSDKTVVAWGDSTYGGDTSRVSGDLTGITTVAGNFLGFAALRSDKRVIGWGQGAVSTPVTDVTSVLANDYAFAAIKSAGSIVSWGSADSGGKALDPTTATTLSSGSLTGASLHANSGAFYAVGQDSTLLTWGNVFSGGRSGQLSFVQTTYSDRGNIYAVLADGTLYASDNNGTVGHWSKINGAWGQGDPIDKVIPGKMVFGVLTSSSVLSLYSSNTRIHLGSHEYASCVLATNTNVAVVKKSGTITQLDLGTWDLETGGTIPVPQYLLDTVPTPSPTTAPTKPPKPSPNPTTKPSRRPTAWPTAKPTGLPTESPTPMPSSEPTIKPTSNPTESPTERPTVQPTSQPTAPTSNPTEIPTSEPTVIPTCNPTKIPTSEPTAIPTSGPTAIPTRIPTLEPTVTPTRRPTRPTCRPSSEPTVKPTTLPTSEPTVRPNPNPTSRPTAHPTSEPTSEPTYVLSIFPTSKPSVEPTPMPTLLPSELPSSHPSHAKPAPKPTATSDPTSEPTCVPSASPSVTPSSKPTAATRRLLVGEENINEMQIIEEMQADSVQTEGLVFNADKGDASSSASSSNFELQRKRWWALPTLRPTSAPTPNPTYVPTTEPTAATSEPTPEPSTQPTTMPSVPPTERPSPNPTQAPLGVRVLKLYANDFAFAALCNDSSVATWGAASKGGDSSLVHVQIRSGVTEIYSTRQAFAALKTDGSVVTWGNSLYGGDSSSVASSLIGVTKICSNGNAFVAIAAGGVAVSWGSPLYGGDSSTVAASLAAGVVDCF